MYFQIMNLPISHYIRCYSIFELKQNRKRSLHYFFPEEAAVDEWIAKWIHTPQVPGQRLGGYGRLSTKLPTDNSILELCIHCMCGRSEKDFPIGSEPRHENG